MPTLPVSSVLIANRGEIAVRIGRTARRLGLRVVAVHSEADAGSLHVQEADESVLLGPARPDESYLDAEAVLDAARSSGAEAVHPGYGFLSENADFAQAVTDSGLMWVGPPPSAMRLMGDKIAAREAMMAAGVPVAAGSNGPVRDAEHAKLEAKRIGYPLMIKASSGGGGIGLSVVECAAHLSDALRSAASQGTRSFGASEVFLERFVRGARHVEVQVMGLADGTVIALGDRECSVQRRHQKVVEETPAPGVGVALRRKMAQMAVRAAESVGYRNAGTIEYLVEPDSGEFFFLEMNTRLQVEHTVTEMVTGLDLVEQQFRIACGLPPSTDLCSVRPRGHAIELRVCAEDPHRFFPSPGQITRWTEPEGPGVRVDAGYRQGDVVTPHYDSLLAKLCVWAEDRPAAVRAARESVANFSIGGVKTNLPLFEDLLVDPEFVSGSYDTQILQRVSRSPDPSRARFETKDSAPDESGR